ncbi:MAG: hypothetical protein SH847_25645 [Roseiflexaceae bacterium]|nr:hypothetical protein [Roseiflexaceae bacterium]
MTTFPRSPRLRKGALVAVDPFNPLASVIVFQYNPETLSRSLSARMASAGGERSEAQRYSGPPDESISVKVEIDAADQLEHGDGVATRLGIYPQLAALEMILYPKVATIAINAILAKTGIIEVVAPEAPLTLFIWGVKRVLPVRLASLSIEEEAYDANLNPIRASVSFSLQVLTYQDLPATNIGYGLSIAHQAAKEAMAVIGSANGLASAAAQTGMRRLV